MANTSSHLPSLAPAGAPLIGIARLAAHGEHIRAGHNVEYLTLEARTLLSRCTSPRMPFQWTINPYRGCEFGCKYCYARYTHEFMELRDGVEFERRIYVKQNAAWLLRRDLKKLKPGEQIAIGAATDPYQPAERRYGVTRAILEELARHRGLDFGLITKSDLILRDLDLFCEISAHNQLSLHITITTLSAHLARLLEPRAPRPDLRLRALAELAKAGLDVGVSCAPVLPGITDSAAALEAVVKAASGSGARFIHANALFLKPCSAAVFMPFLEKQFPHLSTAYKQRYGERAYASAAYQNRISRLLSKFRAKYGFNSRRQRRAPVQRPAADQLALF